MSLPSRLLGANPSIQVSTLLSGSLTTPSAKGTFVEPGDFFFIQSVNPTGTSTITFNSIPQTYKHLQLRGMLKDSEPTDNGTNIYIQYNGNYCDHGYQFRSAGTIVQQSYTTTPNNITVGFGACSRAIDTGVWGSFIIDIHDYASTSKYKTFMSHYDQCSPDTGGTIIGTAVGTYTNTAAITSISLIPQSSRTFVSGSIMSLYGIKGA